MVNDVARIRPRGPRPSRLVIMLVLVASFLRPAVPLAAPAAKPDLAAFDRGFRKGQDEFNRQNYLEAARVWSAAAGKLPEAEEHRENRRAIHDYIAEAYEKALGDNADDVLFREGLAVLDAYVDSFKAAYPGETLPEYVTKTRLAFRTLMNEREAERKRRAQAEENTTAIPVSTLREPPRPARKPWKPLAIGGGVAVAGGAAMLGMFAAGLVAARSAASSFDDPANACDLDNIVGECADINRQGKTANAIGVIGYITAPLLLGAGITMLVVAMRRKKSSTVIAPIFSSRMAGFVLEQRF